MMSLSVIILAAGMGKRLYPLTENTPKCLLELGEGRTVLKSMLENLRAVFGKLDMPSWNITVVTGFCSTQVEAECEEWEGVNTILNPFYRESNSIASLWMARDRMKNCDRCLIINGDVCTESSVLEQIRDSQIFNSVLVDSSKRYADADYKVDVASAGVVGMGKCLSEYEYCAEYAGITQLDSSGAAQLSFRIDDMVRAGNYKTWYETALVEMLHSGFELGVVDIAGKRWFELDFYEDLQKARLCLL